MIDYLEELLEEEGAVDLTGRPLVPVGRRKDLPWEDQVAQERTGPKEEAVEGAGAAERLDGSLARAGIPSWAEETLRSQSGGIRLLDQLTQKTYTAGMIRQQGKPLTVTLPGESPQGGGMDLVAVDRAVQRDARRYDGGFSLY
ncbi:MAG: hypothetical protein IKU62_06750 [Ruminiclostridium sp.]|nr:hypothetical protein [Ruminiclostridium sp.]